MQNKLDSFPFYFGGTIEYSFTFFLAGKQHLFSSKNLNQIINSACTRYSKFPLCS
jgi:hypothetical protein